jgi:hypothetical protein
MIVGEGDIAIALRAIFSRARGCILHICHIVNCPASLAALRMEMSLWLLEPLHNGDEAAHGPSLQPRSYEIRLMKPKIMSELEKGHPRS